MTATRNNLKSVSVFGNSVNSLSPGKETIISLSRSRLSVKKLLPRKWLKNRLFWAKSGHFVMVLRDVFLEFCSRAEAFSVKKLRASEKPVKNLWDSTVHIFRIYAFAESAYLSGFESLSRGFEGGRSKIHIESPKNSKKTVGSRNRCKFRIAAPNSYKFHVGKDRVCKIGQTADRGRKMPLNCDGR